MNCDLCDKVFSSEARLNRHNKSKKHIAASEVKIERDQINKLKEQREARQKLKQQNRDNGTYNCTSCKRNYGTKRDLTKHYKTKIHLRNNSNINQICDLMDKIPEDTSSSAVESEE